MRQINPQHIDALLKLINSSPYFRLLNIRVCELREGYSKIQVNLEQKHLNPFGSAHGGVYASAIDTAAYWAAYCGMDEDAGFTSIDLSVSNLAMVQTGLITAEGHAIKTGRSLCLCEAAAADENGRLLAHGTSKLMVLQGKQSVADAIRAMGAPALPEKFL
ncbi:MAG TPA: PaaI family thioesterase [Candidatus Merdivicinus intestinigallinarum]|nr:PaaI family thioesterase [Candidatus Merdivicinus intestinigallinarum]